MGRLSKHLGLGEPLIVDGETYYIKPLRYDKLGLFLKLSKKFGNKKKEEIMDAYDDETISLMTDLIDSTLRLSFPDEPETDLKQFGLKYAKELFEVIMKANSNGKQDEQELKLEQLRSKVNAN